MLGFNFCCAQNSTPYYLNAIIKSTVHETVKCKILSDRIELENDGGAGPCYNEQTLVITKQNVKSSSRPIIFFKDKRAAANNKGCLVRMVGNNEVTLENCLSYQKNVMYMLSKFKV